MCEYDRSAGASGTHRFRSLLSGAVTEVRVRRKVVDATYNSPLVPSTHTPRFSIGEGVRLVPPNAPPDLGTSAAAWAEFLCGPERPGAVRAARQVVPVIVPFDEAEARVAARLFNAVGRRRGSMLDCMIAATAIRADVRLATADRSHFEPLTSLGLRLV